MTKTPDYSAYIALAILGIVALAIVFAIMKAVFKRKAQKAAETERILKTPVESIGNQLPTPKDGAW